MDSANSMRSPVAQPQSSEGRQRKRPRIPTQSPSMPSQESDMVSSSHHMEVGSASPIPQAPSQTTPEIVQRIPNPNRQQKRKKKNPKSVQEFVQDMLELMGKKLDIQRAYQDEKLRFMREQAEKLFALESRRLDLEFMRMEQQMEHRREDSRIRELALQVELEMLHGNS